MAKYTYKDVIIDPEDPRVEIGKEYYFGDSPGEVLEWANGTGVAEAIDRINKGNFPFNHDGINFPCIIRKKEPEKKYVPFDLDKPEVRKSLRGKWIRRKDNSEEKMLWWFWKANGYWITDEDISPDELLRDWIFDDGTPCGKLVKVEEE